MHAGIAFSAEDTLFMRHVYDEVRMGAARGFGWRINLYCLLWPYLGISSIKPEDISVPSDT